VSDGTNVEVGLGTMTGATTLTRDHVLFVSHSGVQDVAGGFVNFAAGTKNVYSNPSLLAATAALWQRMPNQVGGADAGYTEDILSGTFTATVNAGSATATATATYKVSSSGIVSIKFPAALTATANGTTVTITGIPAFLSNLGAPAAFLAPIVVNGVLTLGYVSLAAGATPTTPGTATISQFAGTAPFSLTATFTTAQVNGIGAGNWVYAIA
jgi:hypothetical protein